MMLLTITVSRIPTISHSLRPSCAAALQYAVDPEVLKTRTNTPTVDTAVRNRAASFKQLLVNRDAKCVFTGWADDLCEGTHIIPFHKGDEVSRRSFSLL
jgi:hypothetical protein